MNEWCVKVYNKEDAILVEKYIWGEDLNLKQRSFPYWYHYNINGEETCGHNPHYYTSWRCGEISFEEFLKISNNMEYKLTKETILKMAEESSEVKKSLKKAFPDVFEDEKYLEITSDNRVFGNRGGMLLERRIAGEFKNKAFWLNSGFNWEIKRDNEDVMCLIPTKKQ